MAPIRFRARWVPILLNRIRGRALIQVLKVRNRWSRRSVLGDADAIVSLTSYGHRIGTVAYAIESIAAGQSRPRELVLWLDDKQSLTELPTALCRLRRRGLRVKLTKDYGPHKKYFPALPLAAERNLLLVTADDDVLYPRSWLHRLIAEGRKFPDAINAYRVKVVGVDHDANKLSLYSAWQPCRTTTPSVAHFATGVSGVLYPQTMIRYLLDAGADFESLCPRADDIWLHWIALRHGVPVRQVTDRARTLPGIPGSQLESLSIENVVCGGNDRVVSTLYGPEDRAKIRDADFGTSRAAPPRLLPS